METTHDSNPRWYVVHTFAGYESKVASNIEKIVENRDMGHLIFDISVPVEKAIEIVGKKEKEIERKKYPCYVMIKMIMNDESWHIVRNTTGVTGFVGPGSKPVPLSDEEVERMGVEVKVIEILFEVGDSVLICDGPLSGKIAIVDEISADKRKVKVGTTMFGRETKVELDSTQVKPLEE